jgi:hypothetical protein
MDLFTVVIVVAVAWVALVTIMVGLCKAASHADATTDRLARLL